MHASVIKSAMALLSAAALPAALQHWPRTAAAAAANIHGSLSRQAGPHADRDADRLGGRRVPGAGSAAGQRGAGADGSRRVAGGSGRARAQARARSAGVDALLAL